MWIPKIGITWVYFVFKLVKLKKSDQARSMSVRQICALDQRIATIAQIIAPRKLNAVSFYVYRVSVEPTKVDVALLLYGSVVFLDCLFTFTTSG